MRTPTLRCRGSISRPSSTQQYLGGMAFRTIGCFQDGQSLFKVLLMITCCCIQGFFTDCPRLCECKWKSGKESVLCLSANLSAIPLHLDAGTQVLDLTGNNVATVTHDEFSAAGLVNLQKVYIRKCRLKTLDRYAFRHLINLVELDLSFNALPSVPSHIFDSIPELRELKLSGNPIQRVVNNAFVHVPQLVRLEMSNCKVGTVEPKGFVGLENSLEWLNLDGNRLVDIRSTTLTSLQSLHGLELAGNPWNCSCTLRPLREWMLRHNVPYGVPPVCRTPDRLADKPWDRLELDEFACAPAIEAYIPKAHGVEGRNVTMSCRIGGVPEPNVRWMLKNRVIANLSGVPYSNGKKLYVVHLQDQASNLTILTADVQDAGVYVCAAENKAGRAEASVVLAVSRRPMEGPLAGARLVVVFVVASLVIVLAGCVLGVCACGVRRRRRARGGNGAGGGSGGAGGGGQRRDESYEKIEMNNKVASRNNAPNSGNGIIPPGPGAAEVLGPVRRRGDYCGVPTADTDVEPDEEDDAGYDDDMEMTPTPTSAGRDHIKNWSTYTDDKVPPLSVSHWNNESSETDLHIPRRTNYVDNRDDYKKPPRSTSGTFNEFSRSASGSFLLAEQSHQRHSGQQGGTSECGVSFVPTGGHPRALHPHIMRKQVLEKSGGSLYTTASLQDDSHSAERNYPDLLELPSFNRDPLGSIQQHTKDTEALYGRKQIDNLHCTLPRKRGLYSRASARCHNSTDSEAPLLADSRCSSSGGEDNGESYYGSKRRLSGDVYAAFPLSNLKRIGQRSNSFLNLSSDRSIRNQSLPTSPLPEMSTRTDMSATPLLNITDLDSKNNSYLSRTSPDTSTNANTYDYHAAQLERFLEEYRSLQEQLNKMKETCEGIRGQQQQQQQETARSNNPAPTLFLDPLLYNSVVVSSTCDDANQPKSILKNKTPTMAGILSPLSASIPDAASPLTLTPGDFGDDPPPYWLSRNALLKRFNGNASGNNYNFQS